MLVVFATNINPETLVDAAFLRRIQTKIKLGACSDEQFHEIFRRVAASSNSKSTLAWSTISSASSAHAESGVESVLSPGSCQPGLLGGSI